jgi:hypothetical protein
MTVGDIVFISEAQMQQANVNLTLDRPTILIVLNEALQQLYPIMLMADDTFWVKSVAFSAGTQITNPANFRATVAVEIPTAAIGAARKVGHREWQTVVNNTAITPTADDPIYRVDAGSFQLAPSLAGTHYYLRTIPEITSYTQDLFAFDGAAPPMCMWTFQEALMMQTAHLLTLREAAQPNLAQSEVKRMFDIAERFKMEYDRVKQPLALFTTNTMMPTVPPEMGEGRNS